MGPPRRPTAFPMRFSLVVGALLAVNLVVALRFPPGATDASTALRLDLPSLARRAELVIEGRVLAARTVESEGGLATEYLFEVARTLKGESRQLRALLLPGGVRADGSGLFVPGLPSLVPGAELLLFLDAEGRGGVRLPTGLAQGRLALERLADGTKRLVSDATELELVEPGARARGGRAVRDYAEVVARIEAALGSPGR